MGRRAWTAVAMAAGLATGLLAGGGPAQAKPGFHPASGPGIWRYRYETHQVIPGQLDQGWRTDFDIVVGRGGAVDAIVLKSAERRDKTWTETTADDACLARLHAPKGALAKVRIWPLSQSAAHDLGPNFLDSCAPAGVFFPLTDILNVMVAQRSPTFGLTTLKKAGDTSHFAGFTAAFDRNGETLAETTHGGVMTLISLTPVQAVVDWAPAPAELHLKEHSPAGPVILDGTETWDFRLVIDPRTGVLVRADTQHDVLDMTVTMDGLPPGQHPQVKITREVSITLRE